MKSNILKLVIGLIFLIVFNVLFFLLGGTERSDTEWVCYGFIHAAYLCLLVTPLFCNAEKERPFSLPVSIFEHYSTFYRIGNGLGIHLV